MGDVTKALMLPDLDYPATETLRNLALYWDEIVCPRYLPNRPQELDSLLVEEGVVRPLERRLAEGSLFPTSNDFDEKKDWGYRYSRDESGTMRVELGPPKASGNRMERALGDLSDEDIEVIAAIDFFRHLGFIDDSLAIASENNLAPISHSVGGHLATVIGSSQETQDGAPTREAALLSVSMEAFSIDQSVTTEEILSFRSRHVDAQRRLRGSLVDLASKLRSDASPTAMLAEARDTYKNRVEPALGDLEEALKESRITFFLKSVVGATAIAIAPIDPVSSSVGAARILGQSIDYSYSKSKLLREHPYGYLHEVKENLVSGQAGRQSVDTLEVTIKSPRESLALLWKNWWKEARELNREIGD
jgi:hypothetical protein